MATPIKSSIDHSRPILQFRLVHLLYATALIASSVALIQIYGCILSGFVLTAWRIIFCSQNRIKSFAVICGGLFLLLLIESMPSRPFDNPISDCRRQLRQINYALLAYHDKYKTLPPAYVADENGKPMHSWRVLILPFMEQQKLYDAYRFDEPWDGPNNIKLNRIRVPGYQCFKGPGDEQTNYFAVVGPNAAWSGSKGRTWSEVTDGNESTILVIEAEANGHSWMKPVDLSVEEATRLFNDPDYDRGHIDEDFFYQNFLGRNVGFCDGSVEFIKFGMPPQDVRRMLIINDGDSQDVDKLKSYDLIWDKSFRRLRLGNWIRLALFIVIIILPTPWVFMKRGNDSQIAQNPQSNRENPG